MLTDYSLWLQAICLEEMMCTRIEEGDLYYGTTKRREHVEITDSLRQEVEKYMSTDCISILTGSIHQTLKEQSLQCLFTEKYMICHSFQEKVQYTITF